MSEIKLINLKNKAVLLERLLKDQVDSIPDASVAMDGKKERCLIEHMVKSAQKGLDEVENGNTGVICSLAGSMQGLSKDMDVLGDEWLAYVPPEVIKQYGENMYKARKRASNIWWTIGEYWDNDEEILDEEITGPVDEDDLLSYLKPGESPD
ncbi:MAG TPA: hypothetical protein ENI64_12170 [Gammaproteobacteria bacterium]|nr:hypothetical protein [Gammaproteobacteria bacterium]